MWTIVLTESQLKECWDKYIVEPFLKRGSLLPSKASWIYFENLKEDVKSGTVRYFGLKVKLKAQ